MDQIIFISVLEPQFRNIIREECRIAISELTALPSQKEKILNAQESADFLGVSLNTFYGYTSKNQIPHFKKLKFIYCYESALADWLKTGKKKTKKEIDEDAIEYIKKINKRK